jgi:membrane associated rhomboid family serine protease
MDSHAEPWIAIASAPDERRAADLGLMLTARSIEHVRQPGVVGWDISVPVSRAAEARAEIAQYVLENRRAIGQRRVEEVGDGLPGTIAYVAILLAVFFCVHASVLSVHVTVLSLDWFGAGRLVAGRVAAGEWWRTVTALTLHWDLDHLGGNLVFGAFFGFFIGRYLGLGIGWLAVIGAATLANVLAALLLEPAHTSLGASTAVFAALGILTAYTWRRGYLRETPWRWRLAPIVAGLGLLAFTGAGGENTDLFAHLAGFVAGFGTGLALARWLTLNRLKSRATQRVCAALTLVLIAAAWAWGLLAAG